MNVLFPTSWFPSKYLPTNGNFVERHLDALIEVGHKVLVVHVEYTNRVLMPRVEERDLRGTHVIHLFAPRWMRSSPAAQKRINKKLLKHVEEIGFKPEIIHAHVLFPIGQNTAFFKNHFQVPLVLTEHWSGYKPENTDRYTREVARHNQSVFEHIDLFLPVSENLGESMREKGIEGEYRTVPNCVHTDLFDYKKRVEHSEYRFIHISNFDLRAKNTEGIIDAFVQLPQGSAKLIIAGDGDTERIRKYIESKGDSPDIELKGQLNYSEVAELMLNSDTHVLFSNFENLPCVIAEMHCTGGNVIATDVGGIPEMVDESNGILVKPRNVTELKNAMLYLIENRSQFDFRQIGSEAHKKYSLKAVGDEFTRYYDLVLEK